MSISIYNLLFDDSLLNWDFLDFEEFFALMTLNFFIVQIILHFNFSLIYFLLQLIESSPQFLIVLIYQINFPNLISFLELQPHLRRCILCSLNLLN